MRNIYFNDQEITFNDLYFVCYMIERTARTVKQHNKYVVDKLGKDGLARQLSIAETNHCLNPEQVVSDWREEYGLTNGDFDITKIDKKYTDIVPSETQMGKVYARLTDSVCQNGELVDSLIAVYSSPICEAIDNYNSSAYYEPSYVQTRAYYNGNF